MIHAKRKRGRPSKIEQKLEITLKQTKRDDKLSEKQSKRGKSSIDQKNYILKLRKLFSKDEELDDSSMLDFLENSEYSQPSHISKRSRPTES